LFHLKVHVGPRSSQQMASQLAGRGGRGHAAGLLAPAALHPPAPAALLHQPPCTSPAPAALHPPVASNLAVLAAPAAQRTGPTTLQAHALTSRSLSLRACILPSPLFPLNRTLVSAAVILPMWWWWALRSPRPLQQTQHAVLPHVHPIAAWASAMQTVEKVRMRVGRGRSSAVRW